jgi:uncharacterized protein (DUF486 family)
MGVIFILLIVTSVFLKFTWYDKLEKAKPLLGVDSAARAVN